MPLLAPTGRTRWLLLAFLGLLQFLIALDVTVVNIALPAIGADLAVDAGGLDVRSLTWVVTGYTVAGGGLLMVGGRIADRYGRRRTVLVGATVFGLASLAAGLAPTMELLVLARFAQGAGEALAAPAAMSLLALLFPGRAERARALGVWAAVASCGLVFGFLLSGLVTELLHWRWIFLGAPPLVAVVIAAVLLLIGRDPAPGTTSLDVPGALLLTAAPLLLITGIVEAGGNLALAWGAGLAGVGAVVAFVLVERRAAHPLVPPAFFGNRARVAANLATALLSAALSTSFFLLTLALQEARGLAPIEAGLAFLPLAGTLILATTVVAPLVARIGERWAAALGVGVAGLGTVWLAAAPATGVLAVVPGMVLVAAGMGVGLVALQALALDRVTADDAGMAAGIQRSADQLGGAGGVALYVGIGFGGALDPYVLATAGVAVAVIVTLAVPRR